MLRAALLVTSLANVSAGIALGSLYFRYRGNEGMPVLVLLVALALFVQGGFTLGYLAGLWRRWKSLSTQLFVAGEFAAALVGSAGTLQGVLYNLQPVNGDREYGPMTAAIFMTVQALIGLLYAVRNGEFPESIQAPDASANNP